MLSKSDTCLLVANHPTQIVVTRPDDVDQDDDHDEEDDKKTTTSPRSSSANNIYKMHQEIDNDNFISSTIRKIKQPLLKTYNLFHMTQTLLTEQ